MGVFYETLPTSIIPWIMAQHLFYVASAPLSAQGHINVSPKGGPYFGLIPSRQQFWYQEFTGSGNETLSHMHERNNGRICILFNAYEGPPKIFRLYGKGKVLENGSKEFDDFASARNGEVEEGGEVLQGARRIDSIPGTRSIIVIDITQTASSCGFTVPLMKFEEHRDILQPFFRKKEKKYLELPEEKKEKESMDYMWAQKNAWSMDGLPGMKRALIAGKKMRVKPVKKLVGSLGDRLAYGGSKGLRAEEKQFTLEHLLLGIILSVILGALVGTRAALPLKMLQSAVAEVNKTAQPLVSKLVHS